MKHFGWEQIDNGRGSIRQIGNTDVHIHFMRSTQLSSFNLPGKIQLPRVRSENLSSQFRSRICFVSQNFPCFWIFPINIVLINFFLFSDFFYKYSIQSVNMIQGVGRYEIFLCHCFHPQLLAQSWTPTRRNRGSTWSCLAVVPCMKQRRRCEIFQCLTLRTIDSDLPGASRLLL